MRPSPPDGIGFVTAVLTTEPDEVDGQAVSLASSPTRRRLLALIAMLPATSLPPSTREATSRSEALPRPDPTLRLFAAFQARLAEHEHALRHCDRLEGRLVSEIGYPRVRLPTRSEVPARYAIDTDTIGRHVRPGPRRERLQWVLKQRQERWVEAAHARGLMQAQEREEALFQTVRAMAETLYAMPVTTPTGILLKLLVLLCLEEPGEAARNVSPWRELRLILLDLGAIATERKAGR